MKGGRKSELDELEELKISNNQYSIFNIQLRKSRKLEGR